MIADIYQQEIKPFIVSVFHVDLNAIESKTELGKRRERRKGRSGNLIGQELGFVWVFIGLV